MDVPPLVVSNWVWLSIQHLPLVQPSHKLDHWFLGLFPVETAISLMVYFVCLASCPSSFPLLPASACSTSQPSLDIRTAAGASVGARTSRFPCMSRVSVLFSGLERPRCQGYITGRHRGFPCSLAGLPVPSAVPAKYGLRDPRGTDPVGQGIVSWTCL